MGPFREMGNLSRPTLPRPHHARQFQKCKKVLKVIFFKAKWMANPIFGPNKKIIKKWPKKNEPLPLWSLWTYSRTKWSFPKKYCLKNLLQITFHCISANFELKFILKFYLAAVVENLISKFRDIIGSGGFCGKKKVALHPFQCISKRLYL